MAADLTEFSDGHVPTLEAWIDEYTEQLPPLTNFILPVGNLTMNMDGNITSDKDVFLFFICLS